jgi:type I restriction enzyme S subunit
MAGDDVWSSGTLSDFADVLMGTSPSGDVCNATGEGLPLLNGPTEFGSHHPLAVQFTTAPVRTCEAGDILFCVRGSTTGKMNWADQSYAIGRGLAAIRHRGDLSLQPFVRAVIEWRLPSVLAVATGSTFPSVSRSDIEGIECPIPPLPEQKRIAHILGTLDDKIELNRRMNATLEAMSRAIFKSWFVDFDPVRQKAAGKQPVGMDAKTAALFPDSFEDSEIGEVPKGWRTCVLDDFTADVIGGDWGESEPTDLATTPCRCVRGADMPSLQEGGVGKMPLRYLKPSSVGKRQLNAGDIAVEISGGSPTQSTGRPVLVTAGLLNRLDCALVASNFCRIVKLQHPSASQFLYFYLRHLYDEDTFLQYENGTTGIKNFAYTLFASRHPLLAPDDRVIDAFATKTTSLSESAQHKAKESEVLAALRDTLLPELLSGEIRIPEAEQAVEEATA